MGMLARSWGQTVRGAPQGVAHCGSWLSVTRSHAVIGLRRTVGASLAKFWCTAIQTKVVDRCLKIYGGTNEIMQELVARSL